jgi:plastocyanin
LGAGHRPATRDVKRASRSAVVALALLTVGCGSGSQGTAQSGGSTADAGGTVHVVMKTLDFTPTAVQAKVGQQVMWSNEDTSPHNVTYVSGPRFASSRSIMNPGAKFSITVTTPGTIHYFCSLHPWMKATIVVSP